MLATHTPLQLRYRTWDRRLSWAACPFRLGRLLLQTGEGLNHAVLCAGAKGYEAKTITQPLDGTPEGGIPLWGQPNPALVAWSKSHLCILSTPRRETWTKAHSCILFTDRPEPPKRTLG